MIVKYSGSISGGSVVALEPLVFQSDKVKILKNTCLGESHKFLDALD